MCQTKAEMRASASSRYRPGLYRPNMLRTGGGGSVPRMARHRISFNSSSSFRSALLKSSRAERAAVDEFAGLRSSSEMRGFSA